MSGTELVGMLFGDPKHVVELRMGTIPNDYTTGRPTVIFDGETAATTRAYPYLSWYTPAAGDRVLLGKVGTGWVILGDVV